ncbi:MAG: DUF1015 domain-containing protein [Phycisphaerales bacterium]|jgi:uncharacterized protein (DUF1015 family)
MPHVYPFRALTYSTGKDLSGVVAPPYDVLDHSGKQKLLAKDGRNIVAIDLPNTPAKELGPQAAYDGAAAALKAFMSQGVLTTSKTPVMFAYRQTFTNADGRKVQRSGMTCCVETVPFGPREGGGILPHEETFSGPKEDRMALMKATQTQMSPIFGLHADDQGLATALLHEVMDAHKADHTATTDDGTLHEVWTIADAATQERYAHALRNEDIFIADGHHRYTTGLNYLAGLKKSGSVPVEHPARRCMIVLIGMSDPGLVIWPTHRVLGGMKGYSFDAFTRAAKDLLRVSPAPCKLGEIEREMMSVTMPQAPLPTNVLGLYDFATSKCYTATFVQRDPLKARFHDKPRAWRELDVGLIQYAIVENICQAALNGGEPVKWAFPHTIAEVAAIGRGEETGAGGGSGFAQLAIIVKPTPLRAVREISQAGQLMPQKSTFFYPKLATGLFINPLH